MELESNKLNELRSGMKMEFDGPTTKKIQDVFSRKIRGFEVISKYAENTNLKMPKRATKYSAGYDIYNNTDTDIIVKAGELSAPVTTFIKSFMKQNEFLALFVRGGHGFKYSVRLANSTGIIDSDYYNNSKNEGEIFVKFHNQGDKDLVIKVGEAMAQAIFINYLITDDDTPESLEDRNGGFGSTTKITSA